MCLGNDRSMGPEIEERVDVVVERIRRFESPQYVVDEDVGQQRPHEQERRGAGIVDADHSGLTRAVEVAGDELQAAFRRTVFLARIERHDERGVRLLMHRDDEVLHDRRAREREPFLRDASQHDTRVCGRIHIRKVDEARGQLNARTHGRVEESLLGVEVPQHGRRSDLQLPGDVRERRRCEALLREELTGDLQDLLIADCRRPAHL